MRTLVAMMSVLSMLGFGGAAHAQEETPAGRMCLLKVSGMHCGACQDTVEKAAKKIDGVTAVRASQPKGTAEIAYDPKKTSPEAIARTISERTPFKADVPEKD